MAAESCIVNHIAVNMGEGMERERIGEISRMGNIPEALRGFVTTV
jgi:hypothetical protein